jgi:stage II sporulation protein AA (anti-sigma F factor antagonist)
VNTHARVSSERRGAAVVATVEGEVDAGNVQWVGARVRAELTNRSDALVLDLVATSYVDSAGIALLFALAAELRLHQQVLQLVIGEGSVVARLAQVTGLDATVPVFPTADEALASLERAERDAAL